MIKAYPTEWEIIDEAVGLVMGTVTTFDDITLKVSLKDTVTNSDELLQISHILKQIEDLHKVGLS